MLCEHGSDERHTARLVCHLVLGRCRHPAAQHCTAGTQLSFDAVYSGRGRAVQCQGEDVSGAHSWAACQAVVFTAFAWLFARRCVPGCLQHSVVRRLQRGGRPCEVTHQASDS